MSNTPAAMAPTLSLYLLRHGDAEAPAGVADADRPLSARGRDELRAAASFLRSLPLPPACIVSSPLLRAVQSAEIVARLCGVEKSLRSEYLVPGAPFRSLMQELDALQHTAVLLVGHEPHLSSFLSHLTARGGGLRVSFPKGSLALVEGERPLTAGGCVLHGLLHASHFSSL